MTACAARWRAWSGVLAGMGRERWYALALRSPAAAPAGGALSSHVGQPAPVPRRSPRWARGSADRSPQGMAGPVQPNPRGRRLAAAGFPGLRRALAGLVLLGAAGALLAVALGTGLPAPVLAAQQAPPTPGSPPPGPPCIQHGCNTPGSTLPGNPQPPATPLASPPPAPATATPEPTPRPTAAPTPRPTAAPTTPPTPYSEHLIAPVSDPPLPPGNASVVITPRPTGTGSSLPELALLAMVVCAVIAGSSFLLFFRAR